MSDPREPETSSVESPPKRTLSPDKFEHEAVIGRTPTTVVHRVSIDGPPGRIAVKHPARHGTMPGDVFESFRNEAKRWAQFAAHEHIVGVLDWAESSLPWIHHDADLPWIAMEYMDGGDLSKYAGKLDIETALWTAEQLADAVWYAHHDGGGVIHHDLKPENVLFRSTPEDQYDVPKIADWELARTLLDHTNSVGVTTPLYVAPEQAYNDPTDQRTDQFQLGIVLYELFTGVHPFVENPETAPEAAVINGIIDNDPTPPTEVGPATPPELDDILGRMLAKDPGDRYEAMLQVRNALRSVDDESAVSTVGESRQSGRRSAGTEQSSAQKTGHIVDVDGSVNVSTGIVLGDNEYGTVEIKSDLARDGILYLSDLDRSLDAEQEVTLFYEGTDPSASDILDVQPSDEVSKPPVTEMQTVMAGTGVVVETIGDSKANIRTDLANDGVFYLSDLDADVAVGDDVILYSTEPDPTASDISSVVPAGEDDGDDGNQSAQTDTDGSRVSSERSILGSWPRDGYDRARTFHAPKYDGPRDDVSTLWESTIGSQFECAPVVAEGTVYAATTDGLLFALDASSGEIAWQSETRNSVVASPTVVGDTVYVGSKDASVYAIDRAKGRERWTFDTGSAIYGPPTVVSDRVIVTTRSGTVFALHAQTGGKSWDYSVTPGIRVPVTALSRRRLLFGDDNGVLHAVSGNGSAKWTANVSSSIRQPITAVPKQNKVLIGATAFDLRSNTVDWELDDVRGASVPALTESTAYYLTRSGVEAYDTSYGSGASPAGYAVSGTTSERYASPAIAGDAVYTGIGDGTLVSFDASTGREHWSRDIGAPVVGAPAVVDDYLFAATRDGTVVALAKQTPSGADFSVSTDGSVESLDD